MSALGLYSIGVRDVSVPDLLRWAEDAGVPFVHLRGGPRGVDLARQDTGTLELWRRCTRAVPVTGVTADLDVGDVFALDPVARAAAREDVARLAVAAAAIGAGWVRLLGRTVASPCGEPLPVTAVPVLIELHHPAWVEPAGLAALDAVLEHSPNLRVLADTAQLSAGTPAALRRVLDVSPVVHLSDSGAGLHGHERVAGLVAQRIRAGQCVEVAVEWTGQPRTRDMCLTRYRSAGDWWAELASAAASRP